MRDIFEIISIIKEKNNLKSETQVAEILGMSQQVLSAYKKRGTIPYQEIIEYCHKESLSLDWLFTGVGETNLQPAEKEITLKDVKRTLDKIESLLKKK